MAVATATWTAHTAVGQREDLQEIIYDISPEETPFLSNVGRTSAKAVLHEWQTDALAAASTANAYLEGDEFSGQAVTPTVRRQNRCQISRKDIVVSGTMDAVDKAGRAQESSYLTAKAGRELKRDMEAILTGEHVATAGSIVSARALAAVESWLVTNRTQAAANTTGSTPAYTNTPSTALTDGTQTAIDETIFKSVIASIWTQGGNPRMIMCGAFNKSQISGFGGIASLYKNAPQGQATIVAGAMAERTKFRSYLIYSLVVSAVIYPIVGYWVWGGGWLAQMGYLDFAGSSVVHSVGGLAGLIGTIALGDCPGPKVLNGRQIETGRAKLLWKLMAS